MMGYGTGYGPGGYGGAMSGGGWVIGVAAVIFGILFIVLVVVLILWAIRSSHGHAGQPHGGFVPPVTSVPPSVAGHEEAVSIAKKRLATGEITAEQYAEIMRHLGG